MSRNLLMNICFWSLSLSNRWFCGFSSIRREADAAVVLFSALCLKFVDCIYLGRDKFPADTLFKFRVPELLYCQWVSFLPGQGSAVCFWVSICGSSFNKIWLWKWKTMPRERAWFSFRNIGSNFNYPHLWNRLSLISLRLLFFNLCQCQNKFLIFIWYSSIKCQKFLGYISPFIVSGAICSLIIFESSYTVSSINFSGFPSL